MKKFCLVLITATIVIFAGACNSADTGGPSGEALYLQERVFENVQELNDSLISGNISESGEDISIFDISIGMDDFELKDIILSGNNIHYRYVLDEFNTKETLSGTESGTESESNGGTDEISSDASGSDEEAEESEDLSLYDEIGNTLSVSWNYTGNGEEVLQYFVDNNSYAVFPVDGYEKIYYSDSTDSDDQIIAKMLYWVQDDCFFSASVPADYTEYIIEKIYSDSPLAKKADIIE